MVPAATPLPAPRAELLVVGGRSYAFGLRWTTAAARTSLDEEARRAAEAEGASHVAIHPAYNQFGLGSIPVPATGIGRFFYRPRAGIAAVARAAGGATLAAFPLDDGRWLVLAIDRKGFLPDGDMIVADAEQARSRIKELIAQSPPSWRRRFVPDTWGISDARSANPAVLLARVGGPRLVPLWWLIHRRRIRTALAAAAALVAAGSVAAVRIATAPSPPALVPFQPPKPIAAVWTPAGASIDQCLKAFREAARYEAVPGWLPSKYSCQGGDVVSVTLNRRGNGQFSVVRQLVPEARLSDDGLSAAVAIALPPLPRLSATGSFATREHYRVLGLDLAQRLNGSFTIQGARKPIPGEADATPPNQAWTLLNWSYQTQAPPPVWAGAIARFGAVCVDTLTYSPAENLWQIAGSLYASR